MKKFNAIWKETYHRQLKSVGFWITTLAPVVLIAVVSLIGLLVASSNQKAQEASISLVSSDQSLVQGLENSGLSYHFVAVNNEKAAANLLNQDDIAGYVVINHPKAGQIEATFYHKPTSADVKLEPLDQALTNLVMAEKAQLAGVDLATAQDLINSNVLVADRKLDAKALKEGVIQISAESNAQEYIKRGFAYLVVIIMFTFVMSYASLMGQEIATEKGTRMMEVVLSSTTATSHFFGKFFGIIMTLLTQVLIYILLLLPATFFIPAVNDLIKQFIPGTQPLLLIKDMALMSVLYTILGIFLYIAVSAFLGSMVSKVEDAAKSMAPLTFIGVAGFYIGMFALSMPNNDLVRFGSLFPFFTPFVMPFRLAAGTVDSLELILATVFMILVSALILWASVLFYRTNVLIYSDKGFIKNFKESLSLFKQERQK